MFAKFATFFDTCQHMFSLDTPEADEFESYHRAPMRESEYYIVQKLIGKYNIPVYDDDGEYHPYVWDGHALDIRRIHTMSDMCHEIGHFVVCPPEYRQMINYGLGGAPADGSDPPLRPHDMGDLEEEDIVAGVFGFFLEYLFCGEDLVRLTSGNLGFEDTYTPDYRGQFDLYLQYKNVDKAQIDYETSFQAFLILMRTDLDTINYTELQKKYTKLGLLDENGNLA